MYLCCDMSEVREVLESIGDLIWPRRCAVCNAVLDEGEECICRNCLDDIPLTRFWLWSPNPAEERLEPLMGVTSAASLYFYRTEGPYNILVQNVKYRGDLRLGKMLGGMLGRALLESGRFSSVQAVVCIPLHPLRRWRRGYNQAEVEAAGVAEAMNLPLVRGLLRRSRYTRTQTRLKGSEKARNVKGAFTLNRRRAEELAARGISGILLIDDVLTSGATLSSAAGVLKPRFEVSVATMAFVE